MGIFDSGSKILSRLKSQGKRPPLEGFYIYILALLIGFSIADLSILNFRPSMLPQKAPPSRPKSHQGTSVARLNDYNNITARNIFNADGKIPPALSASEEDEDKNLDGPAVLSKLPLKLLGTIVHANPKKSVATINMVSQNKTSSFKIVEKISSLAEITKIERRKVTFKNLANSRMEYIEIPKDSVIEFGLKGPNTEKTKSAGIDKNGEFSYSIKRSDLDQYTNDLPSILKQARMVPNILPGSGGKIDGFRFVSIQPDSVFSTLGFKPGDVIRGVNNEPVSSPAQAMELYQALKSSDRLSLNVLRDGKEENFDYSITE